MDQNRRSKVARLIALALVAAIPSAALAQGVTGSAVTGTVKDPSGGTAEGAAVTLKNQSTGATFTAVSDAGGKYFLDNVPPGGPYTLTAASEGYQPVTKENIQLALGQRLQEDLEMKFAGEMISIEAHADALDDKTRTGLVTRVQENAIQKMPLQGRNFTDLIQTTPLATGGGSSSSIAGQNNRLNNIQIDGGANNDLFGLANNGTPGGQANAKPISLEAIREFQVQVAPFDVRLSNFQGGLINAITKSGTNEFHGSLFGYNQNKALARPGGPLGSPQAAAGDPELLAFNTWQFGGTLSGPIVKDKLHFFGAVDIQQRQSAFGSNFNLTGADANADRSRAGFDTATAQRFVDILQNRYGISNVGNALAPDLGNPDRNVFFKLTTSVIDNSELELSYNFVKATQDVLIRAISATGAALPTATSTVGNLRDGYELSNSGYGQANSTNTFRGKLTSTWGRISNEFLAGASIVRDERSLPNNVPLIFARACSAAECPPTGAPPGPNGTLNGVPVLLSAGAERFSQGNSLDQDVYQLQDNVTFTAGTHRLTFGTSNELLRIRNVFVQAGIGVWAFRNLDELEAGTPIAFQRRFSATTEQDPGTAKFNAGQVGLYVQDEWQPFQNLTVTPGFRVDVPYLSRAVRNQAVLDGPLHIDTSKVPSGNPLWSPRVGFNWDVEGNSNTVVRGGAGLFTGRPAYVWVSNAYAVNGISQVELDCFSATPGGTGVPAFTVDPNAQPRDCAGGTGTTLTPPPRQEIDYFDPGTRFPQNFRVAVGADRRLPFGIVASVDVLYTRDVNGWYVTDENLVKQAAQNGEGRFMYAPASGTATSYSIPTQRIDTTNVVGNAIKVRNKNGAYQYSGSFQLSKQFSQALNLSVAYAYSHSEDLMSLTSSQALSNYRFAPLDGEIQNRSPAPSAFDRPHKITITGTAALPYGFGVGLSYVAQSGTPYTFIVANDVNGDGFANDLVFVPRDQSQVSLNNPASWDQLDRFISSQSCLNDARGGFVRRGACRNPWANYLNTRVTWISPAWKGQRIEAQFDIFNLPNLINKNWALYQEAAPFETANVSFLRATGFDTPNNRPIYTFTQPTSNVVSTIYDANRSRWRMQLGAKYNF